MKIAPQNLRHLLNQALPYLHNNVVEDEELSKLEFFEQEALAPFRTPVLFFECPLKGERKWVDLSMRLDPFSEHFMPSIHCLKEVFCDLGTKESWERCLRFLSQPQLKTGYYGIELDIGSGNGSSLTPNLFICTRDFQGKDFSLFVRELMELIEGKAMSQQCKANLDQHVEVCSSMGDQIFACGIMLARPGNGIRVHSSFSLASGPLALEERLKKIGYSGSIQEMLFLLQKLPPYSLNNIGLSIDIGEKIGPKVGIERFEEAGKLACEEWGPLLDLLVQEAVAAPEMIRGCLDWVGGSCNVESPDRYSLCARRINHFKLVSRPNKQLEAKIYLNIIHSVIDKVVG